MNNTLIECDFCSASTPEGWYIGHEGFQFIVVVGLRSDTVTIEAGRMAACPTCWSFVQAKDLKGLHEHYFERHPDIRGSRREVVKQYIRAYHGGVFQRLTGEVEHRTWASPKSPSPRFYVYKCRNCGEEMQVDGSTYDRYLELTCPHCGREIAIIGKPDLASAASLS